MAKKTDAPEVQEPAIADQEVTAIEAEETEVKSHKVPEALTAILKAKPSIKDVYVNEDGEWLFVKRPGYTWFDASEII